MRSSRVVLALVATLLGTALLTSHAAPVTAQAPTGGLTLPNATGTLAGGSTAMTDGQFAGSVTLTRLTYRTGQLVADGSLTGTVTPAPEPPAAPIAVTQSFRDVPIALTDPNGGACDSLSVDLGPVFLDVPGRTLDLQPIAFDLATAPRSERVLGNLACAVATLLESTPTAAQVALLNELLPSVNRALTATSR